MSLTTAFHCPPPFSFSWFFSHHSETTPWLLLSARLPSSVSSCLVLLLLVLVPQASSCAQVSLPLPSPWASSSVLSAALIQTLCWSLSNVCSGSDTELQLHSWNCWLDTWFPNSLGRLLEGLMAQGNAREAAMWQNSWESWTELDDNNMWVCRNWKTKT